MTLAPATARIAAGTTRVLRLRPGRLALAGLRTALAQGRRPVVRVRVSVTPADGGRATVLRRLITIRG